MSPRHENATNFLDKLDQRYPPTLSRRDLVILNPSIGFDAMRTRTVEMYLGCAMISCGGIFALPGSTTSLPHYEVLRTWIAIFPGHEQLFGLLVVLMGTFRLIALAINGRWRRTPLLRILGCAIGSMFWMTLTISILEGSSYRVAVPLVLAFTLVSGIFEVLSGARAAIDAFRMDSFRGGKIDGARVVDPARDR